MVKDRIAVIDLETTGKIPNRNTRVLEIGIVVISPDGSKQEYETLVNADRDVGPTRKHHIWAADVSKAPTFADIAGDVLSILADASIVTGHNIIGFDYKVLVNEYERINVALPQIPLLCTYRYFGRNLEACCEERGISFDGMPHRAISDARATAKLVSILCEDDPLLLDECRLSNIGWPSLPASNTPAFCREDSKQLQNEHPSFLQRIATKVRHDVEAEPPSKLDYMAFLDQVLEDRVIDENEEEALVAIAENLRLSRTQIEDVHVNYLKDLAITALDDGVLSYSELHDLHHVAKLLGQDVATLDSIIKSAAAKRAGASHITPNQKCPQHEFYGKSVCFTGTSTLSINGEPIEKRDAQMLAATRGLKNADNVTKKLDILVVADPDTPSGKAKKAEKYGIRKLYEIEFWRKIGVPVA